MLDLSDTTLQSTYLADFSECAVVFTDARGRVQWVNAGYEQLTGYTLAELHGRTAGALLHGPETDPEAVAQMRDAIREQQAFSVEVVNYTKAGEPYWVFVNAEPIRDETGQVNGFVAVELDITDRKGNEQRLTQERDRLSDIVQLQQAIATAGHAIESLLDHVAGEVQRLTRADAVVVELLEGGELVYEAATGSAAEHHGMRLAVEGSLSGLCLRSGELIECGDAARDERVDHTAAEQLGIRSMVLAPLQYDGETFGVIKVLSQHETDTFGEAETNILRVAGGLLSATIWNARAFSVQQQHVVDRTEAIRLLEESEGRFRTAFASAGIGKALVGLDGSWLQLNRSICEFLGYEAEELRATTFQDITFPEDLDADLSNVERLLNGEIGYYQMEKRYIHKEGHLVWGLLSVTLLRDDDGRPQYFISEIQDISKRKRFEQRLKESEERFRRLVHEVQDYAIVLLDAEGRVASWNQGGTRITGYDEAGALGQPLSVFYVPDLEDSADPEALLQRARWRGRAEVECWQRRKDGTHYWASVAVTPIYDEAKRLDGYTLVTHDLTDRRVLEDQLRYTAHHDELTELPNRRLFMQHARRAMHEMKRDGRRYAVLFFDMDRFKWVNDTLGHGAGDVLLTHVASRLIASVREADTVARLGGDEFAVLIRGFDAPSQVDALVKRLTRELRKPYEIEGETVFSGVSIGIVLGDERHTDAEELLREADAAMYRAKRDPHMTHAYYDDDLGEQVAAVFRLEHDLRRAFELEQLRVYYQPIIDLRDGSLAAFEALVRWQHPTRGLLAPAAFINLAEEIGLLRRVDRWMLRAACRQMQQWRNQFGEEPRLLVNVNCSNSSILQPGLHRYVAEVIEETGVDPEQVVLEVTERLLLDDVHPAADEFEALKQQHVQLCLDDFGTDRSSLGMLQHLPLDSLKIDRSFVRRLGEPGPQRAILEAVVGLAHALELEVVAEGVETPEQLAVMRHLRCEFAQGYLFAQPMDADAATELVASASDAPWQHLWVEKARAA